MKMIESSGAISVGKHAFNISDGKSGRWLNNFGRRLIGLQRGMGQIIHNENVMKNRKS